MNIVEMRTERRVSGDKARFAEDVAASWAVFNSFITPLWQNFITNKITLEYYINESAQYWDNHVKRCEISFNQTA